jgi:hypothetical protein
MFLVFAQCTTTDDVGIVDGEEMYRTAPFVARTSPYQFNVGNNICISPLLEIVNEITILLCC